MNATVDPEVRKNIITAIENSQQKMVLCEERRMQVKQQYSDVETETARLREWEVCM